MDFTEPTSVGCSEPINSFISVVLPAPLRPTSAARDPCVILTFAAVRMYLSVPGYLNDTSFMYIITFCRDLTPFRQGLAHIAHHVIRCNLTQDESTEDARAWPILLASSEDAGNLKKRGFILRWMTVPGRCCTPRYRIK